MRSHLEFRSAELMVPSAEEIGGARVAQLVAGELPNFGFVVKGIVEEDWGWVVRLENDAFPLWIGCGHYLEHSDGHLCFIEPSKPFVRRWLRRVTTEKTVARLASALDQIITSSGKASDLRWWTEAETARG